MLTDRLLVVGLIFESVRKITEVMRNRLIRLKLKLLACLRSIVHLTERTPLTPTCKERKLLFVSGDPGKPEARVEGRQKNREIKRSGASRTPLITCSHDELPRNITLRTPSETQIRRRTSCSQYPYAAAHASVSSCVPRYLPLPPIFSRWDDTMGG